jgi:hypothetical protein
MSRQYKREVTVIIGNKESVNIPNALKITDLRVTFSVEKDIFGIPNLCKASIYNLSESTRSRIDEEYTKIIINAGYEGKQSLVFAGNIMYPNHRRNNQGDIITDIICGDGHFAYTTSFYNNTINKGMSRKDVFEDVAKQMNLKVGDLKGFEDGPASTGGFALSGPNKTILDNQANDAGVYWSIQNEEIITVPIKGSIGGDVVVFNQINGMIGSPIITEIGISLDVLLNARLRPGSLFKVESVNPQIKIGNYYFSAVRKTLGTGTYRINKLVHTGDTHGDVWTTAIEGFLLV